MIDMTILVKVMPGKGKEFIQAIRSLEDDFEQKLNLRKPVLYQVVDDRRAFSLACELGSQEDLNELLDLEEFKVLIGALTILCEESSIRYRHVIESKSAVNEQPVIWDRKSMKSFVKRHCS
ncbi:MAG: hypothetical protein SCH71_12620 [Desulfobulbaceae bacterium]|nr:hypothetical protein [Desulfobulbaceae bacterium]